MRGGRLGRNEADAFIVSCEEKTETGGLASQDWGLARPQESCYKARARAETIAQHLSLANMCVCACVLSSFLSRAFFHVSMFMACRFNFTVDVRKSTN